MRSDFSFKRPPVREVRNARAWTYPKSLFAETYAVALSTAEGFLRERRPQTTDREWLQLRNLLVHECEMAKAWRQLWDSKDDPQRANNEWFSSSAASLGDLTKFIEQLHMLDQRQGFDLRDVFFRSAQLAISPTDDSSAMMPGSLPEGGFEVPTGGRVAQAVELDLLARLFLGQFDQWLNELRKEIETRHVGFHLRRRIGPMFVDPPIGDASMAKFDSTQLAILALTGRLRKALTLAVRASPLPMLNYSSLGGDMPEKPVGGWKIIMDFVQIAFKGETVNLTEAALKQRWSNATKGRRISFSAWPEAVERQASR